VLLGFITFTGSLMAAGKLQEVIPTRTDHLSRPERGELRAVRHRGAVRRRAGGESRELAAVRGIVVLSLCSACC
jgi:NAD/NADP transhydrogenase beta subunit